MSSSGSPTNICYSAESKILHSRLLPGVKPPQKDLVCQKNDLYKVKVRTSSVTIQWHKPTLKCQQSLAGKYIIAL